MASDGQIRIVSYDSAAASFPFRQQIIQVLTSLAKNSGSHESESAVLQQIEGNNCPYCTESFAHSTAYTHAKERLKAYVLVADDTSSGLLLCTVGAQRQHVAALHVLDFDTVGWHGQAMASLAAAMLLGKSREQTHICLTFYFKYTQLLLMHEDL